MDCECGVSSVEAESVDEKKRRSEESGEVCGICLEAYEERVETACGHSYCKSCVLAVLAQGSRLARCPLCREALDARSLRRHKTGEAVVAEARGVSGRTIAASVGCVWRYSDQFARGLGDYDVLTEDSWLVVDVCYYHVGAEAQAVPPGEYVAAFRVKRLKNLCFRGQVVLYLDGVERRRVVVPDEIRHVGVWDLLVVGSVDVAVARDVSASMRAFDQTSSKSGLVIDCLVLYPPSRPPDSLILTSGDSRPWTILRAADRDRPAFRRPVHLRRGRWFMEGHPCRLRRTQPISFKWPGTDVLYALVAVVDNQLVWRSDHPDTHAELRWVPRHVSLLADCPLPCTIM